MSGWGTSMVGYSQTVSLLNSLRMDFSGGAWYVAGPTVKYAVHNERGTSKMKARPFMRPAAERVQANTSHYVQQVASAQGIDITTEDGIVRAAALAVQNEGKRIADAKGVRDTGNLIASISIEKVS